MVDQISTDAAGDTITSDHNVQMVKLGVNYRFNWGGPVVARY